MKRVLIIGGYGNFGSFIARQLASNHQLCILVAGRSLSKAEDFIGSLVTANKAEALVLDINQDFSHVLIAANADIVIHTSGPFQSQSYHVAITCIACRCHYIDLADGRDFVTNITSLNRAAKDRGILVVSGASSVPCLTGALIEHYQKEFERLDSVNYGITTAQKTNRGLATTTAILSYTGKPFKTLIDGQNTQIYGWQNLFTHDFSGLGKRLFSNCEIPDLSLFPVRYPDLKTLRFYAGIELNFIHFMLWIIAWGVRIKLIRNLQKWAPALLRVSHYFDWLGTKNSAFFMELTGTDKANHSDKTLTFELVAKSGDGHYIPCMPAILLTEKLANNQINLRGATPCLDIISLDEYLNALAPLDISWQTTDRGST